MKKIIVLGLFLILALTGCKKGENIKILEPEEAKAKVEKFINDEMESSGVETKVVIKEISEETGLYKLLVVVENQGQVQEVVSYMTRDGSKFFTQAINMNEALPFQETAENELPLAPKINKKQEKPQIELFVMSYCPYGLQIEKGILLEK